MLTTLILPMLASPAVMPPPPVADHGPEDQHERPAIYDDPWLRPPIALPPISIDPTYPRAAQFIPADPSNYSASGITSFDYVVVHTIQGSYEGAISWFQNPDADVSAHYVIRSEDGEVTQMLHDEDRGWHVGSQNPFAIGIEHEGFVDEPSWYTWNMYLESARLARHLCDTHDIPVDRDHVVGHVELPDQTHTDPGPNWRWDIYMALIEDVVPLGRVEGVVVDRTRQCSVTATSDTWITSTLMPTDDHADDEKCFVPAGTELPYLHASPDMEGQRRLTMEGGGPCEGIGIVEWEAFIWGPDFTEPCAATEAAAAGVTVSVDGLTAETAADGAFAIDGLTPGAYALDVLPSGGYDGTTEPFDLEVYPGARIIVAVDPLGGGTTGAGTGDTGGGTTDTDGGTTGSALPPGAGEHDGEGCGCRTRPASGAPALAFFILAGLGRRRR